MSKTFIACELQAAFDNSFQLQLVNELKYELDLYLSCACPIRRTAYIGQQASNAITPSVLNPNNLLVMTTEEKFKQIEDYLSGALPAEAMKAFEERIAQDDRLKKELELHRDIATAISSQEEHEVEQFRTTLASILNKEATAAPKPSKNTNRTFLLLAIVVAILLGVIGWFFFRQTNAPAPTSPAYLALQLPDANTLSEDLSIGTSRGDDNTLNRIAEEIFQPFLENYSKGDFQAALTELNTIPTQDRKSNYAYFLGITYLQLSELEQAQNTFEQVVYPYTEVANWYLALIALQQQGKTEAVRIQLEQVAINSSATIAQKAQAILDNWE